MRRILKEENRLFKSHCRPRCGMRTGRRPMLFASGIKRPISRFSTAQNQGPMLPLLSCRKGRIWIIIKTRSRG